MLDVKWCPVRDSNPLAELERLVSHPISHGTDCPPCCRARMGYRAFVLQRPGFLICSRLRAAIIVNRVSAIPVRQRSGKLSVLATCGPGLSTGWLTSVGFGPQPQAEPYTPSLHRSGRLMVIRHVSIHAAANRENSKFSKNAVLCADHLSYGFQHRRPAGFEPRVSAREECRSATIRRQVARRRKDFGRATLTIGSSGPKLMEP